MEISYCGVLLKKIATGIEAPHKICNKSEKREPWVSQLLKSPKFKKHNHPLNKHLKPIAQNDNIIMNLIIGFSVIIPYIPPSLLANEGPFCNNQSPK